MPAQAKNQLSAAPGAAVEQPQVEQLLQALKGQDPALPRTQQERQELCAKAVAGLLDAAPQDPRTRPQARELVSLEEIVVLSGAPGKEAMRRPLALAMLDRLKQTDRLNDRVLLLRHLAVLGREEAVGPLEAVLGDPHPAIRHYALAALEMNPSPQAGTALIAALKKAESPEWIAALSNALGSRREAAAVDALAPLLGHSAREIAEAAAMALGNSGAAAADKALADAAQQAAADFKPVLLRARLLCAERLLGRGQKGAAADIYRQLHLSADSALLKMAALRGLALSDPDKSVPLILKTLNEGDAATQTQAARLVVELPKSSLKAFLEALPKLPPSAQAPLLDALAERGEK